MMHLPGNPLGRCRTRIVITSCITFVAFTVFANWSSLADENSAGGNANAVKILRSDTLKGLLDGEPMKASLIEVTLPPGGASPPHRHPGSVTGIVLEGTLEFAVGDQPVQTLRKGDTFFEPKMILHRVARNPDRSQACRFVVTMVHPASAKQLVIPEIDLSEQEMKSLAKNTPDNQTCTISVKDSINRKSFDKSLPTVGVLLFDNVLMTEVTAPVDVFSKPGKDGKRLFNVITVAQSIQPVPMESGLRVLPDFTFQDCPKLNVLVVSSAYDMEKVVASTKIVEFVKSHGEATDFTMSNCAGAHLIGASGVANGRRIVTYIGGGELLQKTYPELSVQDDSKVSFVKDGRMISSNGNLASYISALELLEEMTDRQHRKFVESQLYLDRLRSHDK